VLERPDQLDTITLQVEPQKELFEKVGRDLTKLGDLSRKIVESIRVVTGINVDVSLVPHNSLPRFEGKARRVKDMRGAGIF
ncbi:MAG: phenylacetate--CoA ligase, partial [Candidatus Bathyarchaeia archaeon]